MFNTKLLVAIARIVALLLLLKAVLVLVMFVWSYFGPLPIPLFDPRASQVINALLFVQEMGTTAFLYVLIGVIGKIAMHKEHKGMMMAPKAAAPARRRGARK